MGPGIIRNASLSRRTLFGTLALGVAGLTGREATVRAASLIKQDVLPDPVGVFPNAASADVLANGVLYASSLGMLYALDAASGGPIWELPYPDWQQVEVEAIVGDTLVVRAFSLPSLDSPTSNPIVETVDPETRARRWSQTWGDIADIVGTINGIVFVRSGGLLPPISEENREPSDGLSAVDAATGAVLWHDTDIINIVVAPDAFPGLYGTRVAAGGTIELVSLDLASGAVLWRVPLPSVLDMFSPDASDEERVYAVIDRLCAFDRVTGETVWQTARPEGAFGVVAVPSLSVLAVAIYDSERHESAITGFDAATGEQRWQIPIPGWLHDEPTLVGETIVAGNNNDPLFGGPQAAVFAVDPATGKLRWRVSTGARWTGVQAAAGDKVYVMARDYDLDYQRLLALDVETGESRWEVKIAGHDEARLLADGYIFLSGAVLDGDRQSVPDDEQDALIAIDAETGQVVWRIAKGEG